MDSIKFLSVPPKFLYQSILSTSTSFKLSSIAGWDGEDLTTADFGDIAYGAFLSSDNSILELFSFDPTTIDDTSIDFIDRGLPFTGGPTPVTANALDWPSGTTKVMLGTDTPQVLQWLKDYIDSVALAGGPDASTTTQGFVQIPTQAQVDAGTSTGSTGAKLGVTPNLLRAKKINDFAEDAGVTDDYAITLDIPILAYEEGQIFTFKANTANTGAATLNVSGLGPIDIKKNVTEDVVDGDIIEDQIVLVQYDTNGNFQLLSKTPPTSVTPIIRIYVPVSIGGSSSTRFDISNPAGTTFRYTWDGTGTNPNISAATVPIGTYINIGSTNFSVGNTFSGLVTGSGTNYFEVTNASGVVEVDQLLGTGFLTKSNATWSKPVNLKYVVVEALGGGGGGGGVDSDSDNAEAQGGGGGGYSKKIISVASLGATEAVIAGERGVAGKNSGTPVDGGDGRTSSFGSHLQATGGFGGSTSSSGFSIGGVGSNGDINIQGGCSGSTVTAAGVSDFYRQAGSGGNTVLGSGGVGGLNTGDVNAGDGNDYGGGGGGGLRNSGDNQDPGAGARGAVIVTEYYF